MELTDSSLFILLSINILSTGSVEKFRQLLKFNNAFPVIVEK